MSKAIKKHKLILNGKQVSEKEFHSGGKIGGEGIPMIAKTISDATPWVSESMGVLPNQVAEERAKMPKHLTATRILDNGAVECTSPGESGRMGWMKHRRGVDNDGGYRETYNTKR